MQDRYAELLNKLDKSLFLNEEVDINEAYYKFALDTDFILKVVMLLTINDEDNILEVGTGSGYQTAFLAEFSKHVTTIEIVKDYYEKARNILESIGYENITFINADGSDGYTINAQYDKILVTAAAKEVPKELFKQLKVNGKMAIAIGDEKLQKFYIIEKDNDGEMIKHFLGNVNLSEFKGKHGWNNE